MVRIKEVSKYDIYDEAGNLLKGNFKDLEDAIEKGVNILLKTKELNIVKIKAEITLTKK
jgi:hypothetical protein